LDGRALANTAAVTLASNAITRPSVIAAVVNGSASQHFSLFQNYRNQSIEFTVPSNGRATLRILNTLGQEVATLFNGEAQAGKYNQVQFSTSGLARGSYFSRLECNGRVELRKVQLVM
jgi:hypothetical protein